MPPPCAAVFPPAIVQSRIWPPFSLTQIAPPTPCAELAAKRQFLIVLAPFQSRAPPCCWTELPVKTQPVRFGDPTMAPPNPFATLFAKMQLTQVMPPPQFKAPPEPVVWFPVKMHDVSVGDAPVVNAPPLLLLLPVNVQFVYEPLEFVVTATSVLFVNWQFVTVAPV